MRSALDIFGSEIWRGKHPGLVLGWSDDQLTPVIELLDPFLPCCLPGKPDKVITTEMKCAIAACARSLVVEARLSGRPVRYSRSNPHYLRPKRYLRGDRYYSYSFVTRAIDTLLQAGLVDHERGEWLPTGGGRQSVVWATDGLRTLLDSVVDVCEPRGEPHAAEVIVLRDRKAKKDIDYVDTDETNAMRAQLQALNDALAKLDLRQWGKAFPIPLMRRIFNGDFGRGGRCYCHGTSFQNIWSQDRLDLQLLVHEVLHPMVEIDYANLHAVIAYTEAGLPIPPGDQYAIDGFDRLVIKRAFNVMLNATARHKAVAALSEELHHKDYELWQHSGLSTRLREECRPFAEKVVTTIEEKHHPITAYFGSDCGAAFMRRDSGMAVQVMTRVLAETGRCPLPIHDSFLVADLDQEVLVRVMQQVAAEEGLLLCLKVSGGLGQFGPLPPSPSLLGDNTL